MEVATCVQDLCGHTTSLLSSLNLQRKQAQFCDCVVRMKESPGQLYPAHRCILAASSPVLASLLSSTGALVELQAPCLSGSVLALLLDYIYTGALPCTCTQQQYESLLNAACYLQMDRLQEALCAWQQNELNNLDKSNISIGKENQPFENISALRKTPDSLNKHLPLTCSASACRELEETDFCSVQRTAGSLERAKVETCAETQLDSTDPHEVDACGNSSTADTNCCSRKDTITANNANTCMSESSGNTDNCRHLTLQNLIQNISSATEGYGVSRVDQDTQKDPFHSAGTIKPETWQNNTEEEIARPDEGTRSSSSPSSSLPHPCCGAVPVICHSSRATMLQLAQVSAMPAYHAVSRASVNSSRAPPSQSASTENESVVKGITTEQKSYYDLEDLDCRNNKDHTGTESWDSKHSSDQFASQTLCYKANDNQSDTLSEESTCSNTDHLIKPDGEHIESGLCIVDHNDHSVPYNFFQNKNHKKHLGYDSVSQNKICSSRGLKYKTHLSFDNLPTKRQRLDWSDCHNGSVSAAPEKHSGDVPLPVEDSDFGSDSYCEDFCPKKGAKEEHGYSGKHSAEMDRHNSKCNLYRPKADWYPGLQRESSIEDAASSQHGHNSVSQDTATEDKRHSASVRPTLFNKPEFSLDNGTGGPSAFERSTSQDLEKFSDTETPDPHFTFTIPMDSNMSDPMYSAVGQLYHGHVHYHCLPQEDTYSHGDRKHSHSSFADHSDQSSDQEETFASPGCSPLRQHFASGATDQFLLLDISTKHAELLVSCKHGANKGTAFDRNDTFESKIINNDREQRNEAASVADHKIIRARTKSGTDCFDEARNKSLFRETNVEQRKSMCRVQSRSRAEVKNIAGVVEEVSKHEEGENKTSTLTVCSGPSVPDSVQASMSSSLSVCIPSTLPASMSTNISAHLSTPVHHHAFQCSLCDRSFSQRGSLNRHVRSHLGVRPFPCPRCPMTFSRQYRVTEHMRVHQRCTLESDFPHPPASSI